MRVVLLLLILSTIQASAQQYELMQLRCKDSTIYEAVEILRKDTVSIVFRFIDTTTVKANEVAGVQPSKFTWDGIASIPFSKFEIIPDVIYNKVKVVGEAAGEIQIIHPDGRLEKIPRSSVKRIRTMVFDSNSPKIGSNRSPSSPATLQPIKLARDSTDLPRGSMMHEAGLIIPVLLTGSLVGVPDQFEGVAGKGGIGYDIGAGGYFRINENIEVEAGFHFSNKIFHPSYHGVISSANGSISGSISEEGSLNYFGMFILVNRMIGPLILGGGMNVSFSKSYSSSISVHDSYGRLVGTETDSDESFLTDKFNNQLDVVLHAGYDIPVASRTSIRPYVGVTLPLMSLFDSGMESYNPVTNSSEAVGINIFTINFGVAVAIGLK